MKKVFVLIALMIVVAGCAQMPETTAPESEDAMEDGMQEEEMPASYVDVSPAEAKELIDTTDIIVIDVSPHYDSGHLPGAVHYYIGDGSLEAAIPTLDSEATYLVYCHVDSVAIRGAEMLIDAGFRNVYRLDGNYGGWVAAGYPVET
jgi:rhodanese-related sulfurtransferase